MPTNTIAQLMLPELKSEAAMTRSLLAKVPQGQMDFSPGHGLHTIGWNASHLADIVGWVPGTLDEPGMDLADFDPAEAAAAVKAATPQSVLNSFDENLAKAVAALESADDAQMAEPWSMKMNGQTLWTMPKADVLRKWVFSHTAHHRGVLSTLLRLAGVEHTSVYEE